MIIDRCDNALKVGYIASNKEKCEYRIKISKLKNLGCEIIIEDNLSFYIEDRKKLLSFIKSAASNDIIIVNSLFELSGDIEKLLDLVDVIRKKKIRLIVINENIDTSSQKGKEVLDTMSVLKEFQNRVKIEQLKEKMKSAKVRGSLGGRPKVHKENIEKALSMYDMNKYSVPYICEQCAISKNTLYNYIRKRKNNNII